MKKITINGTQFIKVRELREELRFLRKNIKLFYGSFDEDQRKLVGRAYDDVIRALYREELHDAKDQDERDAIMEMPGEFMVIRRTGKKQYEAFKEFVDHKPVIGKLDEGMIFSYESMAQHVAEQLGEGWYASDVSPEEYERTKRLLATIFGPSEDEQDETCN